MKKELERLFEKQFSVAPESIDELARSGSVRKYFRIRGGAKQAVGAFSPDPRETRAFISFTKHFRAAGLNVPSLYTQEGNYYLLEDLGDTSLKLLMDQSRMGKEFPDDLLPWYKKALENLLKFQYDGHAELDYSVSVPREEFDLQSILWDLNHFKYYFLKLLNVPFDEQKLEDDFQTFSTFLLDADRDHFMFRDFQSRNIMVHNNDLYFIDYQGGRRGPLQYDLASILFEARTDLPPSLREELLEYYLEKLAERSSETAGKFKDHYYGFVMIRILQAMGAYGLRGIVENKALFLQSIPYAIRNIQWLQDNSLIMPGIPELTRCMEHICRMEEWKTIPDAAEGQLQVVINSFSFLKGAPKDLSGNGGGYVFDCRALPNPGRLPEFRRFTGLDKEVIEFLESKPEVDKFLEKVFSIILLQVESYQSMGYSRLMVNFGCTGGQHRSVYCAERLNSFLNNNTDVNTILSHNELDR